jgi:N-methylhydantoinase B
VAVIDPVTLEVVRNHFQRVAEDMEATVRRTAYSIAIYDSTDFACGVLDAEPNLLAGSLGTPIFVTILPTAVRAVYQFIGKENLEAEDVVICNDPYLGGGTHGNDMVGIYPVFLDGTKLVAFTVFKGHVLDIGGMRPSGYYNNSNEVYQELFRIPPVKLYRGGELNQDVVRLLTANSRLPRELMGDLRSMVSALKTGGRTIRDLIERYSYENYQRYVQAILDQSERLAREKIAKIPEGSYDGEYFLDGDGDDGAPISQGLRVHMRVTVRGERMTIDLSNSSPQSPGPMNSPRANTLSFVRAAFKSLIDPFSVINEGLFRPLEIVLRPGTIFDPISPAPAALWIETTQSLLDLLLKVLAPAMPKASCAATFGSDVVAFVYGKEPASGRFFVFVDTLQGGWGASASSDGATVYATSEGNSTYPMAEMMEANYPLLVKRYELIQDSGGAGTFRGGLGVRRDIEVLAPSSITHCYDRHRFSPPWGILGGHDASGTNHVEYHLEGGRVEVHTKVTYYPLKDGDVLSFRTGGGGGYGDPLERDAELVMRDVILGYVSEAKARDEYGVVVKPGTAELDTAATEELRMSRRKRT